MFDKSVIKISDRQVNKMKIKAHAKINLALDVVRKREDGYHDLEMIMAPIELHDLLYVNKINKGIKIASNNKFLPTDKRNIMYKAAELLINRYNISSGVDIYVYKHIPSQAGLAGGSSDGAAILKAMNIMFDLGLSLDTLASIGKEIGADIPFCIHEKMAFVQGIGEKLEFIETDFNCELLLVKPWKGVSTKKAFEKLDFETCVHKNCKDMKLAIEESNYKGIVDNLQNTLEQPAMEMVKEIGIIKNELEEMGFDGVLMSGSGSCVFAMTKDKELLNKAYKVFRKKRYFVKKTAIKNK